MSKSDIDDEFHFIFSKNLACRVSRIDDANSLGPRRYNILNLLFYSILISVFCCCRYSNNFAACLAYEGFVIGIKWFRHDYFIAFIQYSSHQHIDCFRAAVSYKKIFPIEIKTYSLIVSCKRVQKLCHTLRIGISKDLLIKALYCFKKCLRSLNIRLTDVKPIYLFSCCSGCVCIWNKFSYWREFHCLYLF